MNDRPALRPGVAVGEALRAVARDILTEARTAIDDPAKSDAERVHDFRRAMKRWRALLRLLEPVRGRRTPGGCATRRAISPARSSGARDAQSALDALDDSRSMALRSRRARSPGCAARIEDIRQVGRDDAQCRDAAAPRQRTRAGGRRESSAGRCTSPDLRRRRRSAGALLPRSAPSDAGTIGRRPTARSCTSSASGW